MTSSAKGLESTIRVDQLQSSILSRVVENLKSSQGLSDEQISSALLGGQNIGKSTTVIDGSTVVFFTDLILNPSSSSVFGIKSTVLPSKPDGFGTSSIKPGMVIELSDLLAGATNGNIAGGLGSAIKDIVHLIASNSNGKLNESSIFDGDRIRIPHGGVIKVKNDQEPVYIPLGGKPTSNDTSSADTGRIDISEPVYRPDLNIEESGPSSELESGDYIRKNDVYKRKNHNVLEGSRKSHPTLVSSIVSPSSGLSSSYHHDTPPLSSSSGGGLHTQIQSGATTIFFTDESDLHDRTANEVAPTSTRYITSVESMTRTLTLTTTKVYYTRDSPLTITSVLTTTIPPRTFVSTIIGSRTILGTAGESTKTFELENAKPVNGEEAATTVTTTTLIFNSITTTVVRTLVIPNVQATKAATSVRPSRKPYTPFKPPQRSTTPPSVSIRPPGSRTRSPYLAKYKPSTPKPFSPTPGTVETVPISNSTGSKKVNTVMTKLYDDDQCRPACNSANKEMCREVDGIFKCECRPGFARKEGSNVCEGKLIFQISLK